MPSRKTLRSQMRKAARNKSTRTFTRSRVLKAFTAIEESPESEDILVRFREAQKALDMAVSKGVIHKNNAARRKSRLARYFNSQSARMNTSPVNSGETTDEKF